MRVPRGSVNGSCRRSCLPVEVQSLIHSSGFVEPSGSVATLSFRAPVMARARGEIDPNVSRQREAVLIPIPRSGRNVDACAEPEQRRQLNPESALSGALSAK